MTNSNNVLVKQRTLVVPPPKGIQRGSTEQKTLSAQQVQMPLSFAIGDVVKLVPSFKKRSALYFAGDGVITDIVLVGNSMSYGVGGSAWYEAESLMFVRRADAASLALAVNIMTEEDLDDVSFDGGLDG